MITNNYLDDVAILCGSAHPQLGYLVCKELGIEPVQMEIQRFSDGEIQPWIKSNIRGKHVFIIQTTPPPGDNWIELFLICDAARRASAASIAAVIPYFGYARQDRKDRPRVSIGARVMADILEKLGVSRIITIDLHADQIQGFFSIPVDHLYASAVFLPYLERLPSEDIVIVAPDAGASKRANAYAKYLRVEMALCYKYRSSPNKVDEITVIGNVKNKDAIIVDDIVDTGGTLIKVAHLLLEKGARTVRAAITHPVLSGSSMEKIEKSPIQELLVTDTLPLRRQSPKIIQLSIAPLIADVIRRIVLRRSISEVFIM